MGCVSPIPLFAHSVSATPTFFLILESAKLIFAPSLGLTVLFWGIVFPKAYSFLVRLALCRAQLKHPLPTVASPDPII